MSKKVFYLHLGYPKTGTSYIRKQVSISNRYHYLGKSKKNNSFLKDVFHFLLYEKKDEVFLKKLEELNINKEFGKILEIYSSKDLFYSEENFLIYNKKVNILKRIKRLKLLLDRLNYDNIRILITLRDPVDLLLSYFSQNIISFMYLEKINLENIKNDNNIKSYLNFNELKMLMKKTLLIKHIIFLNYEYLIKNNILNFESEILQLNYVNKSSKIKTENFRIYLCKLKFRDIIRSYTKNKNVKSLLKKIIFNLKYLILYFKNEDIKVLKNHFSNNNN